MQDPNIVDSVAESGQETDDKRYNQNDGKIDVMKHEDTDDRAYYVFESKAYTGQVDIDV